MSSNPDPAEVRAQIGTGTSPRYLLWRVWHGDNPSMQLRDFMEWNSKRLSEFCSESECTRPLSTAEGNKNYETWLMHWVRHEIANKAKYSDFF